MIYFFYILFKKMKVLIINNIIVSKKNVRNYFLKKFIFNKLLFLNVYNRQCRNDEDIQYENDCYYSSDFNYLI